MKSKKLKSKIKKIKTLKNKVKQTKNIKFYMDIPNTFISNNKIINLLNIILKSGSIYGVINSRMVCTDEKYTKILNLKKNRALIEVKLVEKELKPTYVTSEKYVKELNDILKSKENFLYNIIKSKTNRETNKFYLHVFGFNKQDINYKNIDPFKYSLNILKNIKFTKA